MNDINYSVRCYYLEPVLGVPLAVVPAERLFPRGGLEADASFDGHRCFLKRAFGLLTYPTANYTGGASAS